MSPKPSHRHRRQAATPTRVNLGPLTTVVNLPSHCSRAAIAGPSATKAVRGQSCKVNGATAVAEDDLGCWPRATAYPATMQRGVGFYSPGYSCPAGYVSACTAISATKGQTTVAPKVTGTFQFPLVAGETAIGCCPNGYQCAMDGGVQTCRKFATSTQFDAMTCKGQEEDLNAFKVPYTAGPQTIGTMTLWAPLIQMNHFATDLPEDQQSAFAEAVSLGSMTSSEITMETVLPSTPAPTTPMPTETSGGGISEHLGDAVDKIEEVKQERSRLSTGAKIGIAFAPLMVAALIVAFLFYRKWKAHYLYPEEHFLPPRKPVSPSLAPSSPNPSELQRSPYNEDAANAGRSPRTTPYSPPMPQGPHNKSPNMTPFSPPMGQVPYNISHHPQDFATGGPGPVVVSPYAYGRGENLSNIDEESGYHYEANSPPQAQSAQFSRTIGADGSPQGVESPIDGTSPFRLKRGNTLKRLTADRETAANGAPGTGLASNAPAQPSPLGQASARVASHISDSNSSDATHAHNPSQDSIEWEYPLKRERSFSRPRPDKVASVFVDEAGRTSSSRESRSRSRSTSSSLYSWERGVAPSLPEAAHAAVAGLNRTQSFSRPLVRPKRDTSEDTLTEPNAAMPRVTSQAVAF
jgi:hypothetical protein